MLVWMSTKGSPYRFKKDAFKTSRGGRSQFLEISCDRCGHFIALYQKDGPGPLKRMYLDRVFAPGTLSKLQSVASFKKLPPFSCPSCGEELGVPMVYEKEGRIAYKLFESVVKKTKNTKYKQRRG